MKINAQLLFSSVNCCYQMRTITVGLPADELEEEVAQFIERNKGKEIVLQDQTHKRSLNANAYAWVLLQQMAEKLRSDKWAVYCEEIKKYSKAFTHIVCREEAIKRISEEFRAYEILGDISVGKGTAKQVRVYYGSSTFDNEEMSVFLNGIVSDAKELGIQTLEDLEIERIMEQWS